MPISKAVATLNNDLAHLASATKKQHSDEHQYNVDVVKQKAALVAIDLAKKKITDQFAGPTQPTGATEVKLLNQLFALGQKLEQTVDSFAATLHKDKLTIAGDAQQANAWKARGKKDLLPAEYTLSLAETNKDRKALGLGSVSKVIRPPAPKATTYTVKAGDTMSGIAKAHGMTLAALIQANPQVSNPNNISVGQKLNLKPGAVVKPPTVGGTVGSWIAQAQKLLAAAGIPYSKMNAADINLIIQHESSGDPNAQNNWDSNAKAGHPSIGLMQTIGPTFEHYKLPGHNNIRNPVDNICAAVRYAVAVYGSISNTPGVKSVHQGGRYKGY